MWYTKENGSLVCEHGHQRRKCPHCEVIWQDQRIAELEVKLKACELREKMHPLPIADCGGCISKNKRIAELEEENQQLKEVIHHAPLL